MPGGKSSGMGLKTTSARHGEPHTAMAAARPGPSLRTPGDLTPRHLGGELGPRAARALGEQQALGSHQDSAGRPGLARMQWLLLTSQASWAQADCPQTPCLHWSWGAASKRCWCPAGPSPVAWSCTCVPSHHFSPSASATADSRGHWESPDSQTPFTAKGSARGRSNLPPLSWGHPTSSSLRSPAEVAQEVPLPGSSLWIKGWDGAVRAP